MTELSIIVFQVVVLILSVIIHEMAHGFAAYKLGDDTAKNAGRLSFNPIKHLDLWGSFLLPLLMIVSHIGFVFGWAKPVPFNPAKLKNPKRDAAIIAVAGPLSTIAVAIIFGIIIRIFAPMINFSSPSYGAGAAMTLALLNIVIFINVLLAIFNLIPIPPLDGSKILFAVLPDRYYKVQEFLETYGTYIVLFLLIFGNLGFISSFSGYLQRLIAGQWAMF